VSRVWRRLRRGLWNPDASPFLFFLAAYLVGMSVNLASNAVSKHPFAFWVFLLGGPSLIVLAIVAPVLAKRWLGERVEPSVSFEPARPRKWLVVLASPPPGIETAEKAIRHHLPALEKVWLLCSRGVDKESEPAALGLKASLERAGLLRPEQVTVLPLSIAHFQDPEKVREAVEGIYDRLPEDLDEADVIVDVTGGTKLATAGALLAGLPPGRFLEYVPAVKFDERGRGEEPGPPIEIAIDYVIRKAPRR
jgi:hypothetical protein